jgi:hypothetical protein
MIRWLDLDMIDNLKDLSLQMDDFEMIKPLAKGQFGTASIFLDWLHKARLLRRKLTVVYDIGLHSQKSFG